VQAPRGVRGGHERDGTDDPVWELILQLTGSDRSSLPSWAFLGGIRGTAIRAAVKSCEAQQTISVELFGGCGVWVGRKEGFEPQRHRGHRVVTEQVYIPFCDYSVPSVLLTFEITAACDEFPATCREGCVA
jgi:hypothetical protein